MMHYDRKGQYFYIVALHRFIKYKFKKWLICCGNVVIFDRFPQAIAHF